MPIFVNVEMIATRRTHILGPNPGLGPQFYECVVLHVSRECSGPDWVSLKEAKEDCLKKLEVVLYGLKYRDDSVSEIQDMEGIIKRLKEVTEERLEMTLVNGCGGIMV